MKTKNKTLAIVEIAIVLCSAFLVALPAAGIAAEQTTQKVGASTITATSDIYEPGPLDVFGNANEDDTIDMRDTTYIKLAIFGKKPKTDLADANYDGKVSMLDVGQTKLIILGKEKKLTFIDCLGEPVTVNKPIKRLVNLGYCGPHVTRILGARDILVAIGHDVYSKTPTYYPELSKLPVVGYDPATCDIEYILSLEPDAVQTNIEMGRFIREGAPIKDMFEEKLLSMPLISLNMREPDVLIQNVRTYGYILDREGEAEEFIDWFEEHLNMFKARAEGLSDDERPRVLIGWHGWGTLYNNICPGNRIDQALVIAGGINIADELIGPDSPNYGKSATELDPEWVIEQNPAFIIRLHAFSVGYGVDDPSEAATIRQEVLDRTELAHVDAVQNKHVYVIYNELVSGGGVTPVGIAYMGKLFQPDLFKDIDPQALHQEYVDRFCYIVFNVREHGVWVYPLPEEW